MGLYDTVTFESGLDISFPDLDFDPFEINWQTKTLARQRPCMDTYRITADGRLLKEECEYESVPEEERPRYDEELEGFERPLDRGLGSLRKIHHGWSDTEYHGIFELHKSVDGEYVSLDVKFTDGELVNVEKNE